MKKIILLLLSVTTLFAQNPKLTIPPNYLIVGVGLTPPLPTIAGGYTGDPAFFCHNSMIDANGNIKFFIVDGKVYNSTGALFTNGTMFSNTGDVLGSQEVCIVPYPDNCNKYYIFSSVQISSQTASDGAIWHPAYTIVDVSNNSLPNVGGLTAYDMIPMILPATLANDWGGDGNGNISGTRVGITATKQRPDGSYFVFIHDGVRHIYRFKITSSGIFYESMIDIVPVGFYEEYPQMQRAEMEIVLLSNGNYRIATVYTQGFQLAEFLLHEPTVYFTDLAPNGNPIPGTAHYVIFYTAWEVIGPPPPDDVLVSFPTFLHGLEFSPNGRYLYLTHSVVNEYSSAPYPIEYIDCEAPTPDNIPISIANFLDPNDATAYQYSQLELGLDGKIYATDGANLVSLSNPDAPDINNWNFTTPVPVNYNYTDEGSGYTNLKTYLLPDQIDGMNYADQFNTVQCCVASNTYDKITYTAGQAIPALWTAFTQTWTPWSNPLNNSSGNPNVYINQKLTIPAGYNITITGMNIYFAQGASLEIKAGGSGVAGGRLILRGCTLSVDQRCGNNLMWNGVEVEGVASALQTPYPSTRQGKIELMNNGSTPCVIEHALKGITTGDITSVAPNTFFQRYDFTIAPFTGGGIIRATNAIFRNNWFDIDMRDYTQATFNQSRFTNCTFFTDSPLSGSLSPGGLNSTPTGYPLYPLFHVFLKNLKNITFSGCDFRNDYANDASSILTLGYGIRNTDATITVQNRLTCIPPVGQCPILCVDNTNFVNLEYGIFSTNSAGSLRTVTCTDALFSNNRKGILLRGVRVAANILKNNFDIYKAVTPNSTTAVYGLYLHACTGYKVQENTFQDITPTLPIGNSYGVIVVESGSVDNEIYKNTFHNLFIGGQSQGNNGYIYNPLDIYSPRPGLRWKCNVFNDEITSADLTVTTGQIAYEQGFCFPSVPYATRLLAGNEFNHVGTPPALELSAGSGVQSFNYAYHNDFDLITEPNFVPYNYNPTTIIVTQLCSAVYYDMGGVSCPSRLCVKLPLPAVIAEIIAFRTEIAQKKNLIDGGSTSNLLAYINSPSNSIGQKKDMLLSKSPYLSDVILLAYLSNNPPPGHIQQVLLGNSGITNQVWDVVVAMGLPTGIKSSIKTARSTISVREKLYQNLALLNAEKSYNIYEVIGYYLRDTMSVSPMDSIISILDGEEEKEFLATKGDARIEQGELIEAVNIKSQLIAQFSEINDNTAKMMDLNIQLAAYPSKDYGIKNNTNLRNKTIEIAYDENDKRTRVHARALLTLAYDSIFPEIIEDILNANSMPINSNNNSDEVLPSIIKIYPNPVLEELYIEAITNTDGAEVWSFMMVTVTDMQGRVLITKNNPDGWTFLTLALNNIQSGNYIVKVSDIWGNFEVKTFVKVQ